MRLVRLLLAVLAVGLASALAASAAPAAQLATATRCYQEGADVVTAGSDFVPSAFVGVALDGQFLGLAATNPEGVFVNKFVAPNLPEGKRDQLHELVATDNGANRASTLFRTTQVSASFSPSQGKLDTLRVRFRVNGFGLYKAGAKVYVHYVRPNGKVRHTVYLGPARGLCGRIKRTRKRLLFPFAPERGVWKLQFDTREHYKKATAESKLAWVRTPVRVG